MKFFWTWRIFVLQFGTNFCVPNYEKFFQFGIMFFHLPIRVFHPQKFSNKNSLTKIPSDFMEHRRYLNLFQGWKSLVFIKNKMDLGFLRLQQKTFMFQDCLNTIAEACPLFLGLFRFKLFISKKFAEKSVVCFYSDPSFLKRERDVANLLNRPIILTIQSSWSFLSITDLIMVTNGRKRSWYVRWRL